MAASAWSRLGSNFAMSVEMSQSTPKDFGGVVQTRAATKRGGVAPKWSVEVLSLADSLPSIAVTLPKRNLEQRVLPKTPMKQRT
eukprot:3686017-Amphidinium_carterae.1